MSYTSVIMIIALNTVDGHMVFEIGDVMVPTVEQRPSLFACFRPPHKVGVIC